MEWILESKMNQSDFWQLTGHSFDFSFRYNKQTGSLRLNLAEPKLYFIQKKGILQEKVQFITEYSQLVGEYYYTGPFTGVFKIDGIKYYFSLIENQLQISDRDHHNLCTVAIREREIDGSEFSAILFSTVMISHYYHVVEEEVFVV